VPWEEGESTGKKGEEKIKRRSRHVSNVADLRAEMQTKGGKPRAKGGGTLSVPERRE